MTNEAEQLSLEEEEQPRRGRPRAKQSRDGTHSFAIKLPTDVFEVARTLKTKSAVMQKLLALIFLHKTPEEREVICESLIYGAVKLEIQGSDGNTYVIRGDGYRDQAETSQSTP